MAYVKLDCGMLTSTIWMDRQAREVFITALLMAEPAQFDEPIQEIATRSLDYTGWVAPSGWYGFVPAANVGIIRFAGLAEEEGLQALERLASPDLGSRSQKFEGRRLIRVDHGYLVLNYDFYRQKDHTAAERQRRFRERKALRVMSLTSRVTSRDVTQAEAEAKAKAKKLPYPSKSMDDLGFNSFWVEYPRKEAKKFARIAWLKLHPSPDKLAVILTGLRLAKTTPQWTKDAGEFIPLPASWLNAERWEDEGIEAPKPKSTAEMVDEIRRERDKR